MDVFTTRVMSTPGLAVVIVAIVFTSAATAWGRGDGVRLLVFFWSSQRLWVSESLRGGAGAIAHAALACLSKQAESARLHQYRCVGCV